MTGESEHKKERKGKTQPDKRKNEFHIILISVSLIKTSSFPWRLSILKRRLIPDLALAVSVRGSRNDLSSLSLIRDLASVARSHAHHVSQPLSRIGGSRSPS